MNSIVKNIVISYDSAEQSPELNADIESQVIDMTNEEASMIERYKYKLELVLTLQPNGIFNSKRKLQSIQNKRDSEGKGNPKKMGLLVPTLLGNFHKSAFNKIMGNGFEETIETIVFNEALKRFENQRNERLSEEALEAIAVSVADRVLEDTNQDLNDFFGGLNDSELQEAPKVPELKVPDLKVPDLKVPDLKVPDIPGFSNIQGIDIFELNKTENLGINFDDELDDENMDWLPSYLASCLEPCKKDLEPPSKKRLCEHMGIKTEESVDILY
jgi:hypothetical protein